MIKFSLQDIATPGATIDDADTWAVIKATPGDVLAAKFRYMPYGQYLWTPFWKAVARAHKLKAGMRCQLCASTDRLESHHVDYSHKGNEHLHPADLTCLCRKHHAAYEKEKRDRRNKLLGLAKKGKNRHQHNEHQGEPWKSWGQAGAYRGVSKARRFRGIMQ